MQIVALGTRLEILTFMTEYRNISDLKNGYIAQNDDALKFVNDYPLLTFESLLIFGKVYGCGKNRAGKLGSKFSERVFSYWIFNEIKQFNPIVKTQAKIFLPLNNRQVRKDVDLSCEYCDTQYLIEFKANLDMVEKDLFKFWLFQELGQHDNSIKLMYIWECGDGRFDKNGEDNQYLSLLKYARDRKIIDEFFYFPMDSGLVDFLKAQIESLKYWLTKVT